MDITKELEKVPNRFEAKIVNRTGDKIEMITREGQTLLLTPTSQLRRLKDNLVISFVKIRNIDNGKTRIVQMGQVIYGKHIRTSLKQLRKTSKLIKVEEESVAGFYVNTSEEIVYIRKNNSSKDMQVGKFYTLKFIKWENQSGTHYKTLVTEHKDVTFDEIKLFSDAIDKATQQQRRTFEVVKS